jgi:hypothetical protein
MAANVTAVYSTQFHYDPKAANVPVVYSTLCHYKCSPPMSLLCIDLRTNIRRRSSEAAKLNAV